jgi:hypothetical protein
MSRETARLAITNRMETLRAAWSAYALIVEYGNQDLINYSTQVNPFLTCEIKYVGGDQVDLNPRPTHRVFGMIELDAWVKTGSGSKSANDLLTHFFPSMHMTDAMLPVRTFAADFLPCRKKLGWVSESVGIPFYFDTLY